MKLRKKYVVLRRFWGQSEVMGVFSTLVRAISFAEFRSSIKGDKNVYEVIACTENKPDLPIEEVHCG